MAFELVSQTAALLHLHLPGALVEAAAPGAPPLPWRWAALASDPAQGSEATRSWREALTASTARQYGSAPPPAMPAAFVLQWVLEVPASIGAYAAVLGPPAGAPDLRGLSFDLHPAFHFPTRIQLTGARAAHTDAVVRLQAARAAYEAMARPFAEHHEPGVKLGRRQRLAMVDDVWAVAVHRARTSRLPGPAAAGPERDSCCFIYTLPGARECAGCPRLRRAVVPRPAASRPGAGADVNR